MSRRLIVDEPEVIERSEPAAARGRRRLLELDRACPGTTEVAEVRRKITVEATHHSGSPA